VYKSGQRSSKAASDSCCTAPASGSCTAYMQTLSVKLLSSTSEWAGQFFCALDAAGNTRLTPAEDAFAGCLSLSSPDAVQECKTDADCEMAPPLGKGKGYFCALQPCCTDVAPVFSMLPEAMLGNMSIAAGTANRARRICRKDAAAMHANVCTSQQATLNLDSPAGLSIGLTPPSLLSMALNQTSLVGQLEDLQKNYSELVEVCTLSSIASRRL
jgi:hypothetical protein